MSKKLRVIVLMGGKSPEHDVSLVSGREVVNCLDKKKYEVFPVIVSKDGNSWQLAKPDELLSTIGREVGANGNLTPYSQVVNPKQLVQKTDVVFIAMHGPFGEDGAVQGFLEFIGVPYTGAGVLASAIGMDKVMFRRVISSVGIKTPEYVTYEKNSKIDDQWEKFGFPLVVKPASQGSSIGVSIVHNKNDFDAAVNKAFSFDTKIIIEEYLNGTEVTCGILGNKKIIALPVAEIVPKKEFFDYEAKYVNGMSEEIIPARISAKLTKEVQETAVKVYRTIGCRGFGRVDMIIKNNIPYVLEINTISGLTPNSLLPKEADKAGISYASLIEKIINFSLDIE